MKKSYDSKFKSRVALEALRGDLTVAEIPGSIKFIRIWFSNEKRSCKYEIPEGLTVFSVAPDSIGVRRKLRTTNMIEFQNKELKKRTRCIRLFPNRESLLRIATALLIELDETWLGESKRYI